MMKKRQRNKNIKNALRNLKSGNLSNKDIHVLMTSGYKSNIVKHELGYNFHEIFVTIEEFVNNTYVTLRRVVEKLLSLGD